MAQVGTVIQRAGLQQQAGVDWSRLATGAAGLGFALSVAFLNTVLLVDEPFGDASISTISGFFANNKTPVAIAIGLVSVNIPLIIVFASGFVREVRERVGYEPVWVRAGYGGVILTSVFFGATTMLKGALVVNGETLAENPALTQMVWDLHGAAFALTNAALGLTLAMFAVSGRRSGLTPSWLAYPAVAGGGLLVMAGTVMIPTLEGSNVGIGGLAGFIVWLVWLAFTSIRLLRSTARSS